ncbi:phosphoglycerate mutase-like protein [Hypoxylon sp. FL1284]|nr:phosphoglycerate mutase-like protein [Hypoxylon sp. FL1284]
MPPTIDVIRSAEAYHDMFGPHVRDPGITPIGGEQQCAALRRAYPYTSSDGSDSDGDGERLVMMLSSPLRRCVDTALRGIAPLLPESHRVVALVPDLQDVSAGPSGTGSPLSALVATYGDNVEHMTVDEDWHLKGPGTDGAPHPSNIERRARRARKSIRSAARQAARFDDDAHIVVITHGEFAHWLTGDFAGVTNTRRTAWHPAELRSYRFADDLSGRGLRESEDDAALVEIDSPDARERRDAYLPAADTAERRDIQKQIAILHVMGHQRIAAMWAGQELDLPN